MLINAASGRLYFATSEPSGGPTEDDRVAFVSALTLDVTKETQERGPYVGDPRFVTGTSVKYEGSFELDVPRVARPSVTLLVDAAKNPTQKYWMLFREGETGTGTTSSATHKLTGVTITKLSVSNDGETVTYSVEFTADEHIYTASTLT